MSIFKKIRSRISSLRWPFADSVSSRKGILLNLTTLRLPPTGQVVRRGFARKGGGLAVWMLLISGLLFPPAACAVVIWSEDFSSYTDPSGIRGSGTVNIGDYPASVTKWTLDVSGGSLTASSDWLAADGGLMEARDVDGEVEWISESIDISGYTDVGISLDASESGTMEPADHVDSYYVIDDGSEVLIQSSDDDFTSATHQAHDIGGSGTGLVIIVKMYNNAGSEYCRFDNVVVTGTVVSADGPEIAVLGTNGAEIADGNSTPATANGTDFGSVSTGTAVTNTFTITNSGTSTLTNTVPITLTADAAFSVVSQPSATVAADAATTFQVRFAPTTPGAASTGLVSIANNDSDENPYTFSVEGSAPCFTSISGLGHSSVGASGFTASWDAVGGADGYVLDVSTSATFMAESGGGGGVQQGESFNTGLAASYTTGSQTLTSGVWYTTAVYPEASGASHEGAHAARINDDTSNAGLYTPALNTVGTVTFWYRELNSGGGTIQVQTSTDASSWTTVDTQAFSGTTYAQYSNDVNDASSTVYVRILSDDQSGHLIIDDFECTSYGSSAPDYVAGYSNRLVSGTSQAVTGLVSGVTYYYRVTATNTSCSATSTTNSVLTVSGTSYIALADNGTQVAAGSVTAGDTDHLLHRSQVTATNAGAQLTGISFTSAGTCDAADLDAFSVYYSTDSTLETGSDTLLGTVSTSLGAGSHSLSSLNQSIGAGATGYLFITADVDAEAVAGHTLNIPALTTANLTVSGGAKSGSTTAGGTQTVLAAEPTTHATGLSFTAIGSSQMTVSWTNGNGASRIVVVRQGAATTWTPTDLTAYSGVSSDFPVATDQGGGNRIAYDGTGSSFTLTGLQPDTEYAITVFEYNGSGSWVNYYTGGTPLTGSQETDCVGPTASLWVDPTNTASFTANWLAVAGAASYRLDVTTNAGIEGSGGNLMSNGGFESGDNSDWDKFESQYSVSSSDPQAGTYHVTCSASDTRDLMQAVDITGDGSTEYEVSFWYKKPSSSGNARIWSTWASGGQVSGDDLTPSGYLPVATDWTKVTYNVVPQSGANTLNFEVRTYSGATVLWDSFYVGSGSGGPVSYVPGYSNRTVSGTSQSVTGLMSGTTYAFRLRTEGSTGCLSGYSSTSTVTTLSAAAIGLDPVSLDFGTVALGGSSNLTVSVTNSGTVALTVHSNWLSGGCSGSYTVSPTALTVGPESASNLTVTFTPAAAGACAAALVVSNSTPGNETPTVSLAGSGYDASTTLAPSAATAEADGPEMVVLGWTLAGTAPDVIVLRDDEAITVSSLSAGTAYAAGDAGPDGTVVAYHGSATSGMELIVEPGSTHYFRLFGGASTSYSTNYIDTAPVSVTTPVYASGEIIEQFAYTNGLTLTVSGEATGQGWEGAWTGDLTDWDIADDSLSAGSAEFPEPRANRIVWDDTSTSAADAAAVTRELGTSQSSRLFVSFLMNLETTGTGKEAGLTLMSGTGASTEELFFGKLSGYYNRIGVVDAGAGTTNAAAVNPEAGPVIVVGEWSPNENTARIWFYATNAAIAQEYSNAVAEAAVTWSNAGWSVDTITGLRLSAASDASGALGEVAFDELHLAGLWDEVLSLDYPKAFSFSAGQTQNGTNTVTDGELSETGKSYPIHCTLYHRTGVTNASFNIITNVASLDGFYTSPVNLQLDPADTGETDRYRDFTNEVTTRLDTNLVGLGVHTSRVWMTAVSGKATNTVFLEDQAGADDLFFGEFGEGAGFDKYVEIYNGTGSAIDLSGYMIARQVYGSGTYPTYDEPWTNYCRLAGSTFMLDHGETITILNNGPYQYIDPGMTNALAGAGRPYLLTSNDVLNVSGNDPIGLFSVGDTTTWIDMCGIAPNAGAGERYIMQRLEDADVPQNHPSVVNTNDWDYRNWSVGGTGDRDAGYTNFLATAGVYDRNVGLGGYITFTVTDDDTNAPALALNDIAGLNAQNYYTDSGEMLFYDFGATSETNLQPARTFPAVSVGELTAVGEAPDIFSGVNGAAVSHNYWNTPTSYWEFVVTVQDGFQLDLQSIRFASRRSSTSAPAGWELRSSRDGFAAAIGSGTLSTVGSYETIAADLASSETNGIVTYRLYGTGAANNSATWRLDDLSMTGQVSSVAGAFIATDSDLNTNGLAVSATVQDDSGICGLGNGATPPRVELKSPLGVTAPDHAWDAGPANGGAAGSAADLAATNGFTFSDIVLGVYTAALTVTDFDADRPGDAMAAALTNAFTVVDDDTSGPRYSVLRGSYVTFDGKSGGSEANAVTDGDLVDGLSISNRIYDEKSGVVSSSLRFRIRDPEGWDSGWNGFSEKPTTDGDARTNRFNPGNSVAVNSHDIELNGGTGRALGVWTTFFSAADADWDRPGDSVAVTQELVMVVTDDDRWGPRMTNVQADGTSGILLATGFEVIDGWTSHAAGNWTEEAMDGTWSSTGAYVNTINGRGPDSTAAGYHIGFNTVDDQLHLPPVDRPGWLVLWARNSGTNGTAALVLEKYEGGSWTSLGSRTVAGTNYAELNWTVDNTNTAVQLRLRMTVLDGSIYFDDLVVSPRRVWTNAPVSLAWDAATDAETGNSGLSEYRLVPLRTPAPLLGSNGTSLGSAQSASLTPSQDAQGVVTGYIFAVDADEDRGTRDRTMGMALPVVARLDITPPTSVPMPADGASTDEVDDPTTQFDLQWNASAVGPDDPADTRYPTWGGGSRSLLSPWKSYRIYYSPFDATAVSGSDPGPGSGSAYIYTNFLQTGAYSNWPSVDSTSTIQDPSAAGTNYLALANAAQDRIRLYDLDYDQDYVVVIVGMDEAGNESPATPVSWATNNTIRFALTRGRILDKQTAAASFPEADLSNTNTETAAALYWIAAGSTNEQGVYTSVRKDYDLICRDDVSFNEATNNEWSLVGTVRTNWFVDDGGQFRSRGHLRFYRASYKDRWKRTNTQGQVQRPLASEEVYALHNVVLSGGQNFVALHGTPHTNTFAGVFGGIETFPGGVSALPLAGATIVEFFDADESASTSEQYYLNTAGQWIQVGGGDVTTDLQAGNFFTRGFSITLPEPLPTNYVTTLALDYTRLDESGSPQQVAAMVWSPIMQVPTNAFSQVISTGSRSGRTSTLVYNVAALRLPVSAHPSEMRLVESGFVNGLPGQSDEIYTVNTATKGVLNGSTIYCDPQGVWRFVSGNGLVPAGFFKPNDVIVIVSRNRVGDGSWTWSYHPGHFYSLPTRWMGASP